MKAEVFEGTIPKNSRKLYTVANGSIITAPHNSFLKIGSSDTLFKVENSESITIKRTFSAIDSSSLKIKGNYENRILKGDLIKIFFEEYTATNVSLIEGNSKFEEGDILYCQGGKPTISPKDITGKKCQLIVTSVNKEKEITGVRVLNPGAYVEPPQNPVTAINETEKPIKVSLNFELVENATSVERDVTKIASSSIDTDINLSYDLPIGVTEGEVIIEKYAIYLDRDYAFEDVYNEVCTITRDFSPSQNLPLMAPNNPSFHVVYNKAIEMLEGKISSMENRIKALEHRRH